MFALLTKTPQSRHINLYKTACLQLNNNNTASAASLCTQNKMPGVRHLWSDTHAPSFLDDHHGKYKRKTQKVTDWVVEEANLTPAESECGRATITLAQLVAGARIIEAKGLDMQTPCTGI
jgi:hypothetical protein